MVKEIIIDDIVTSDGIVAQLGRKGGKYFTIKYGEAYSRTAGRKYRTFHNSRKEAEEAFSGLKEYYGVDK